MLAKYIGKTSKTEKILIATLATLPFTGWPSWSLNLLGREASIEIPIIAVLWFNLYFVVRFRKAIYERLLAKPWVWLWAWLILGTGIALVKTDTPAVTLVFFAYTLLSFVFAFLVGLLVRKKEIRVDSIFRAWIYIAAITAVAAVAQFLISAFTEYSVVNEGYDIGVFAFPRVSAASFEPLFFAQWLMVPIIYISVRALQNKKSIPRQYFLIYLLLLATCLTLARSAFVAIGITLVVVMLLKRPQAKLLGKYTAVALASLATCLVLVGLSTAHNSDRSAPAGAGRYLDHATLGVFNKEGASNVEPTKTAPAEQTNQTNQKDIPPQDSPKPKKTETYIRIEGVDTEGVVEASTLGRLEAMDTAIDIWNDSPENVLFGVGKNRFGQEAAERYPEIYLDDQVSNNQYVDVLVETGLVGMALLSSFFGLIITRAWHENKLYVWLVLATLIQFFFFSNFFILPFWLLVGLVVGRLFPKKGRHAAA